MTSLETLQLTGGKELSPADNVGNLQLDNMVYHL